MIQLDTWMGGRSIYCPETGLSGAQEGSGLVRFRLKVGCATSGNAAGHTGINTENWPMIAKPTIPYS